MTVFPTKSYTKVLEIRAEKALGGWFHNLTYTHTHMCAQSFTCSCSGTQKYNQRSCRIENKDQLQSGLAEVRSRTLEIFSGSLQPCL